METEILDSILNLLADGKWHSLNEISALPQLKHLTMTQIQMVLNLLKEYDFIEVNERPNYNLEAMVFDAKINSGMQEFWSKIKWIERSERT